MTLQLVSLMWAIFRDRTTIVRIRNSEDLEELWSLLRQPQKNTVLWCDGPIAHAGRNTVMMMMIPMVSPN